MMFLVGFVLLTELLLLVWFSETVLPQLRGNGELDSL